MRPSRYRQEVREEVFAARFPIKIASNRSTQQTQPIWCRQAQRVARDHPQGDLDDRHRQGLIAANAGGADRTSSEPAFQITATLSLLMLPGNTAARPSRARGSTPTPEQPGLLVSILVSFIRVRQRPRRPTRALNRRSGTVAACSGRCCAPLESVLGATPCGCESRIVRGAELQEHRCVAVTERAPCVQWAHLMGSFPSRGAHRCRYQPLRWCWSEASRTTLNGGTHAV